MTNDKSWEPERAWQRLLAKLLQGWLPQAQAPSLRSSVAEVAKTSGGGGYTVSNGTHPRILREFGYCQAAEGRTQSPTQRPRILGEFGNGPARNRLQGGRREVAVRALWESANRFVKLPRQRSLEPPKKPKLQAASRLSADDAAEAASSGSRFQTSDDDAPH